MNPSSLEKSFEGLVRSYALEKGVVVPLGKDRYRIKDVTVAKLSDGSFNVIHRRRVIENTFMLKTAIYVAQRISNYPTKDYRRALETDKRIEKFYWDIKHYDRAIHRSKDREKRHSALYRLEDTLGKINKFNKELDYLVNSRG